MTFKLAMSLGTGLSFVKMNYEETTQTVKDTTRDCYNFDFQAAYYWHNSSYYLHNLIFRRYFFYIIDIATHTYYRNEEVYK